MIFYNWIPETALPGDDVTTSFFEEYNFGLLFSWKWIYSGLSTAVDRAFLGQVMNIHMKLTWPLTMELRKPRSWLHSPNHRDSQDRSSGGVLGNLLICWKGVRVRTLLSWKLWWMSLWVVTGGEDRCQQTADSWDSGSCTLRMPCSLSPSRPIETWKIG